MPVPVRDAQPHRSPVTPAKSDPTGGFTEFLEAEEPATYILYVDTDYVISGYVEGE